ncbi:hypothetical protein [Haladaptatus caseinilyticus]|uniref:hypothetical protein n=1 Tax=Haladaptatus caseinilyticus TaxID=2993314 RepID=UPI00224B3301|nr:hypothetical protein [Haladaptatus caseinilyticus]
MGSTFTHSTEKSGRNESRDHIHEYRFEYDPTGDSTLKRSVADILVFVTEHSRAEAERLVRRRCRVDIDDHFTMLDRLAKPNLAFWISNLNFSIRHDGQILVREFCATECIP